MAQLQLAQPFTVMFCMLASESFMLARQLQRSRSSAFSFGLFMIKQLKTINQESWSCEPDYKSKSSEKDMKHISAENLANNTGSQNDFMFH